MARAPARRWLRLVEALTTTFPDGSARWHELSHSLRRENADLAALLSEAEGPLYLLERIRLVIPLNSISATAREMVELYRTMVERLFDAGIAGRIVATFYDPTLRQRLPVLANHWAGGAVVEPVPHFSFDIDGAGFDQAPWWRPGDPFFRRAELPAVTDRIDVERDELRPWPSLVLSEIQLSIKWGAPPERAPPEAWTAGRAEAFRWLDEEGLPNPRARDGNQARFVAHMAGWLTTQRKLDEPSPATLLRWARAYFNAFQAERSGEPLPPGAWS